MKKLYPLVIIVFCLLTAIWGCSKNSHSIVYANPPIVGKWYFKKTTAAYYTYATLSHADTITNYTASDYILLNLDGSGTLSENLSGQKPIGISYTYATTDSILYLHKYANTDSAATDTLPVTSLTSGNMSWHTSATQSSVDFSTTEVYNYYFSK